MTDTPTKPTPAVDWKVSDPDQIRYVFVTHVGGHGVLNGVLNITFLTSQFTPTAGGKIDPDMIISSRLRMDMACATALRDALTGIIEQNAKPKDATEN